MSTGGITGGLLSLVVVIILIFVMVKLCGGNSSGFLASLASSVSTAVQNNQPSTFDQQSTGVQANMDQSTWQPSPLDQQSTIIGVQANMNQSMWQPAQDAASTPIV